MKLKGIFFTGLLFSALMISTHPSKAQRLEVSLLQYHPLGGMSDGGMLAPGIGFGLRLGYQFEKKNRFITGRLGYVYHWQQADGYYHRGHVESQTAVVSAQLGLILYKAKPEEGHSIYWIFHPQVGLSAFDAHRESYDELGEDPPYIREYSGNTCMFAAGSGPGFEFSLSSKIRAFGETEIGLQYYGPPTLFYETPLFYTAFSAGIRF